MTGIETIKNWFKTGLKPTQEQFTQVWDSFWHKSEKIPINQINGIEQIYKTINDQNTKIINAKIYAVGELQIFKVAPNKENELEIGDFVIGFIEDQFINATYNGGNYKALSSYELGNEIEK